MLVKLSTEFPFLTSCGKSPGLSPKELADVLMPDDVGNTYTGVIVCSSYEG